MTARGDAVINYGDDMRGKIYETTADQCRALGIRVGDRIEGTERHNEHWHTAQLTLLWCGDCVAVWSVIERSDSRPEWSEKREVANWSLAHRNWKKLETEESRNDQRC